VADQGRVRTEHLPTPERQVRIVEERPPPPDQLRDAEEHDRQLCGQMADDPQDDIRRPAIRRPAIRRPAIRRPAIR